MINLVSGLTYLDLVEDELSTSMNVKIDFSIFLRDTLIPEFRWPTMLIAQSHGGTGSGGGAGSQRASQYPGGIMGIH